MTVSGNLFDEPVDDLEPDLFVRLLPPPEPQPDPHLMIVTKELDCAAAFYRQVVRIYVRRKLQLLHSACRLGNTCIFGALGLFVKELAVIHDAADWRRGRSGNLNQVEASVLGQAQRIVEGHYAELLLGFIEYPDLTRADLAVAAMQRFTRVE